MITLQNIHCFLRTQRELDDFIFALEVEGLQVKYLQNRMEIFSDLMNEQEVDKIVKFHLTGNMVNFKKAGKGKYRLSKGKEDVTERFKI